MKDIPSFEGEYAITEDGRVFSYPKKRHDGGGASHKGMFLKPVSDRRYDMVSLRGKVRKVHRLVALTYIPNPENKPFINHKNGIKTDNRVENLEWCTAQENSIHARETKLFDCLITKGEKNIRAVLTEEEVISIRDSFSKRGYKKKSPKIFELMKIYKVSYSCIYFIVMGKNWKHI